MVPMRTVSPAVKMYFRHDRAASVWWNVDNLPRYRKQTAFVLDNIECGGSRILDLGAGKGRFSIAAAEAGASEVTAVDISAQMLREAEAKAKAAGVGDRITFVEGDVEEFASGGPYDHIFLMEILVHLPNPERPLENARNMLEAGGTLVLNIDLPASESPFFQGLQDASKRLYNLLPRLIRRKLHASRGLPLQVAPKIRLETTEEVLEKIDQDTGVSFSRAKDAFRPFSEEDLIELARSCGYEIVTRKAEYDMGFKVGLLAILRPV
jgi:ubiquinone/menaquinone biosynthesis C-methylase UbiE